nr:hypothetical protein [Tanacetum cinerariifolium]
MNHRQTIAGPLVWTTMNHRWTTGLAGSTTGSAELEHGSVFTTQVNFFNAIVGPVQGINDVCLSTHHATLKRVLEGLKSYNNDVKYGYVTSYLSKEDVEYLQLFEEEIKEQLKHRDQMRR